MKPRTPEETERITREIEINLDIRRRRADEAKGHELDPRTGSCRPLSGYALTKWRENIVALGPGGRRR